MTREQLRQQGEATRTRLFGSTHRNRPASEHC